MAKAKAKYSEAPDGAIQRAFRLRFAGMSYPRIAQILRVEYNAPTLDSETVAGWSRGGRLRWDELLDIVADEERARLPGAKNPMDAERLETVRKIIGKLRATINGDGEEEGFGKEKLAELGIKRPLYELRQMMAEERLLTRSELTGLPRRAIRKAVRIISEHVFGILIRRGLVSQDRLKKDAGAIETELVKNLPDVFSAIEAEEVVDRG